MGARRQSPRPSFLRARGLAARTARHASSSIRRTRSTSATSLHARGAVRKRRRLVPAAGAARRDAAGAAPRADRERGADRRVRAVREARLRRGRGHRHARGARVRRRRRRPPRRGRPADPARLRGDRARDDRCSRRSRIRTECANPACPLGAAAVVPLHLSDGPAGAVVAYATTGSPLDEAAVETLESLGRQLSAQLQLSELHTATTTALQAQMEPHFVFNALNTIASFIRTEPERARKLVLAFADHLRSRLARPGRVRHARGGAPPRPQLPRARGGALRAAAPGDDRRRAGRARRAAAAAARAAARRERDQARQDRPAAAPARARARPARAAARHRARRRPRHRPRRDRARARAGRRRRDRARPRERQPAPDRALRRRRAAALVPVRHGRAARGPV